MSWNAAALLLSASFLPVQVFPFSGCVVIQTGGRNHCMWQENQVFDPSDQSVGQILATARMQWHFKRLTTERVILLALLLSSGLLVYNYLLSERVTLTLPPVSSVSVWYLTVASVRYRNLKPTNTVPDSWTCNHHDGYMVLFTKTLALLNCYWASHRKKILW